MRWDGEIFTDPEDIIAAYQAGGEGYIHDAKEHESFLDTSKTLVAILSAAKWRTSMVSLTKARGS